MSPLSPSSPARWPAGNTGEDPQVQLAPELRGRVVPRGLGARAEAKRGWDPAAATSPKPAAGCEARG